MYYNKIYKINLYLLLVTLTIINTRVVSGTKCDGVVIYGHYYEKEVLKTGLNRLLHLAVDYNTNIIYFSYDYIQNNTYYESALFDLNTKELKVINDVPDGFTQTVDQNTHDVYVGGNNGVYRYDYKNHKSKTYVAKNNNIWELFFKDVLYFSVYPSKFVYTYIDGNIARFKDMEDTTVRRFVIDNEGVMIYTNATGLYAQNKGSKDAVLYSKEQVNGLTLDVHGNAYICTQDAIYKMNKIRMSLEKLTDVDNCVGLAVDKDNNFIYCDFYSLVRLKKIHVRYCRVNAMYTVFPILSE